MSIFVQIILNTILTGGDYVLLSLGFNLLYKTRKFIDVSYGSLIAVGGYLTFFFAKRLALPFLPSILFSLLGTVLFALFLDIVIYDYLQKKKAVSLIPLIASLGVYTATTAFLSILFTSQYQTLSSNTPEVFTIFGGNITLVNIIVTLSAVVGSIIILFVLYRTRYGRALRAIDDDLEVAEISGVPSRRVVIKSVVIGALFAGLVGIFIGFDVGLLPIVGLPYLIRSFIVCVMGGLGSIEGGIISAFILSIAESATIYFLSPAWRDPVVFLVFLLVLLFRPKGLFYRPQR